jgi:monoamine oxidase
VGVRRAGAVAAKRCAPRRGEGRATRELVTDVCVIGRGLRRLSAARAVAAAGRSVVVLEARDRSAARALHPPAPEQWFRRGRPVGRPTQDRLLGCEGVSGSRRSPPTTRGTTSSCATAHARATRRPGRSARSRPTRARPRRAPRSSRSTRWRRPSPRRPVDGPARRGVDSMTFATWRDANVVTPAGRSSSTSASSRSSASRRATSRCSSSSSTSRPRATRRPRGLQPLLNVAGGAQEQRFVGGAQQPTLRMAAALAGG